MRPRYARPVCDTVPVGESLTKQEFSEETDINVILRRYQQTGVFPVLDRPASYGDFSSSEDYLSCMVRVRAAEEAFQALPAEIRDAVRNDPAELVDLVTDPARRAEAIRLGVLSAPSSSDSSSSTPVAPGPTESAAPDGGAPGS